MQTIFGIDGPVMRAMRDLSMLLLLNFLTLLCSLPMITAGAAYAALHFILYQIIEGEEGHLARTYFKQLRINLRNGTLLFLVFALTGGLLWVEFLIFRDGSGPVGFIRILLYLASFWLFMVLVWAFPLTAKFVYSLPVCLYNAVLLVLSHPFRTILMVLLTFGIPFLLSMDLRILPLDLLLGISLPAHLSALVAHPVLKKMVKAASAEEVEKNSLEKNLEENPD